MAYMFNVNQTLTGGNVAQGLVFNLKALLVAQGWEVVASGTGTGGTYGAAGSGTPDVIASAANVNTNNGWLRLRMPSVGSVQRELVVQWQAPSGANLNLRVKYSYAAGFVTAPSGAGVLGAGVAPSAADEVFVAGGGTDASPTFYSWGGSSTSMRVHACAGGAAEGYGFWVAAYPVAGGNPECAWVFEPLVAGTYAAEDVDPYVHYLAGARAFVNPFYEQELRAPSSSSVRLVTWIARGLAQQAWRTVVACQRHESVGDLGLEGNLGVNPYSGKDDICPIFYARWSGAPVSDGTTTSPYAAKGVGQMMYWLASVARVTGDVLTVDATRDRIVLRAVCVPWDGSTPLV